MNSSLSSARPAYAGAPDKTQNSKPCLWLVSFGDLLTLLLCFFLSLIALGPLNRRYQKDQARQTPETRRVIQMLKLPIQAAEQAGIAIAFSRSGSPSLRFVFNEIDFPADADGLLPAVLERMTNVVKSTDYQIEQISIEVCQNSVGAPVEGSWSESALRSLSLKSQLLDAGIKGGMVRLRSLGAHCDGLQTLKGELRGTAQVTFEFLKTANG